MKYKLNMPMYVDWNVKDGLNNFSEQSEDISFQNLSESLVSIQI